MIKQGLILLLFSTSALFSAEVSVFGAGNLDSPNPYGLTQSEKKILETKNKVETVDTTVRVVKSDIQLINERLQGLESIFEGEGNKLHNVSLSLNKIDAQSSKNQTDIESLKGVVNQLLAMQEENLKNIAELKKAIGEIAKQSDHINKNYLSRNEFEKNMQQFVTKQEFSSTSKQSQPTQQTQTQTQSLQFDGKSNEDLFNEGKALFDKRLFTQAIPIFEHLVEKRFKPAESNYLLGQMWFVRKDYEKALSYFKTSALLYDKGYWMPQLLLNSAISFQNMKDIDNASKFFNTLIQAYPDSKEAAEAKKLISK
ncbi:tetratricopeptide repeat protein [Arcobacter sp. FWKO B]|uniref:tetratricopeptide repeat protein n=1 Tax=Arcobacter sp. FWKO B TaxID=2593672 RepID=UPI0018A341F8|nr:tetratricopeptide repeat protein [Arcobacter sp. FWKO B]QOG11754.1 tetratricopeptide repeat protein [Arcobacter sp. FWKO B]